MSVYGLAADRLRTVKMDFIEYKRLQGSNAVLRGLTVFVYDL